MAFNWAITLIKELASSAMKGQPPFRHTLLHLNAKAPDERWGSLGLWQNQNDDYGLAAQSLAHALLEPLDKQELDPLLVLGCGHGQEIKYWLNQYPAIKQIHALDTDEAAIHYAKQNVAKCNQVQEKSHHWQSPAHFFHADAESFLSQKRKAQLSSVEKYQCILALDCAYHFKNNMTLWCQAYENLQQNGQLTFTDLILTQSKSQLGFKQTWLLKFASFLFSIPYDNWRDKNTYLTQLNHIGFNIQLCNDLSQEVLHGFYGFTQGPHFNPSFKSSWMLKSKITAWLIKQLSNHNLIAYVLIHAKK